MDLIVVLTCQRPGGVSYLRETCEALVKSMDGLGDDLSHESYPQLHVVSDGPLDQSAFRVKDATDWGRDLLPGWQVHESPDRRGSRHAHWRAYYLAAALGADNLLFFEDDVRPCKNAVRRMLDTRVPDNCAHVTFFDLKELPEGSAPGLHVLPADGEGHRGFWSTLAVKFPRRTIEWLVRQDPFAVLRDKPETSDMVLGRLLAESPWPLMAVHCPSLVQHVGDVSISQAPEPRRLARNWPGYDFDAMTLEVF